MSAAVAKSSAPAAAAAAPAAAAPKKKAAGPKKAAAKKATQKFTIDCSEPAADDIFDIAAFVRGRRTHTTNDDGAATPATAMPRLRQPAATEPCLCLPPSDCIRWRWIGFWPPSDVRLAVCVLAVLRFSRLQEKFLHDRIKIGGKTGVLGESITISKEASQLTVTSKIHISKRYLKVRHDSSDQRHDGTERRMHAQFWGTAANSDWLLDWIAF